METAIPLLSNLGHFLAQLILIILTAQLCGKIFQLFKQPAVIGEVVAGILLGPSFFGLYFPTEFQFVFAKSTLGNLQIISQLGLILFMFTVGLHARPMAWDGSGKKALFISSVSIIFPFSLGVLIAPQLYEVFAQQDTTEMSFALFLGISLSITAFPVLARILQDRNMSHTETGMMALTCAAIDDVAAWTILAGIIGFSKNEGWQPFLWTLGSMAFGVLIFIKGVSPLMSHLIQKNQLSEKYQFILGMFFLLSSALYFEWSGVHALFGAFLAGASMPNDPRFRDFLKLRIESLGALIFLPVFFAMTGLRTQIGLLDNWQAWQVCLGITGLAIIGKLGGGLVASKVTGFSWKDSFVIGVLMNTRGLMELIVLNIGLELGIISPSLFAIMVIMALITTFMAGPCIDLMMPNGRSRVNVISKYS
jgi:Kef-type K+ transport system membrane component KefB